MFTTLAWLRAPILLLVILLGACAQPVLECDLVRITQMPLRPHHGLLTVPVGINGQWVDMLVDTGAERSMVTEDTAERLSLRRDPRFVTRSGGVGGMTQTVDARIDSLVLGGIRFPVDRLAVNRLGPGVPYDGLLGADILLAFDLDIDVRGGALSLYRVRRCPAADPPWGQEPAVPIPGVTAQRDRLMVPIEVDGVAGTALLDTGAQTSALGASLARRLGLTAQAMAASPTLSIRGVGPGTLQARIHRFRSVRIGPAVGQNVALPVLPIEIGFADALIGQDFLRGRRVWVSFPTRRLFVSQHPHEMLLRR
jgi:predicted aspartyl protease